MAPMDYRHIVYGAIVTLFMVLTDYRDIVYRANGLWGGYG